MKQIRTRWLIFPALFLLAMAVGCAHTSTEKPIGIVITTEAFGHFKGEFENTAYFKRHKPKSVAVLPFQYKESKEFSIDLETENPANIIRTGMYNHIASLPFKDIELYNTDKRLKNSGLTDVDKILTIISKNPQKLKSILGVDAVISGEVTHFDRIFMGIYSQVAVGCEVKMWDLKTGNLLWRAKHISRAHAGGLSLNPVGLVMATVASVWNLRSTEMLSQTDDLFREIVSTIELPESGQFAQTPAPRIDLFAAINSGKPFTVGKKAAFRLIGSPECSAYLDLGNFKSGIELSQVGPDVKHALKKEVLKAIQENYKETGHDLTPELIKAVKQELNSREIYEGSYTVEPGEQSYGLLAKAYLVNSAGTRKTAIDAVHHIDIDALPPKPASGLEAESLNNKIKTKWTPNSEDDLAGYEIWSSNTPLSGYEIAARSEKNEAVIDDVQNFMKIYIKVRAVDRANNTSDFSKPIEAVPLPEPGLYDLPRPGPALEGIISKKNILVAEKNPYTVLSDLEIVPGGVLYVEPGVRIIFSPDTGITVAGGGFLAYGTDAKPIKMIPEAAESEPGSWRGVFLENAGRTLLHHVLIEGAETGLTVARSAPSIVALTISHCSQTGIYLKDKAAPNITCSIIKQNEGQGAMVIEGEGLSPVIRNNIFENNSPFQVQSYTPLQIDLRQNYWGSSKPDTELFLGDVLWRPALTRPPDQCP